MERALEHIDLGFSQIESLCSSCFNTGHLKSFNPLSGGAVNTVYRIVWDDRSYILRLYVRDPDLAQVEESVYSTFKLKSDKSKALYHLVCDKVAVPDLVYTGVAKDSYPFGIFEFVDKKHIFEIPNPSLSGTLSYDLGRALSRIHNFRFPKAGLFGKNFVIHTPFEEKSSPYFTYIMEHFTQASLAWQRIGDTRAHDLSGFINNLNFGFICLILRNLSRSSRAFHLENGLRPFSSLKIPRISEKSSLILRQINPKFRLLRNLSLNPSSRKMGLNVLRVLLQPDPNRKKRKYQKSLPMQAIWHIANPVRALKKLGEI